MKYSIATLMMSGAAAVALSFTPAAAQNLPPPGNVNPGSMLSGAEQTGAPNQPRSFGEAGRQIYYGGPEAYGAYATPYGAQYRMGGPSWHVRQSPYGGYSMD